MIFYVSLMSTFLIFTKTKVYKTSSRSLFIVLESSQELAEGWDCVQPHSPVGAPALSYNDVIIFNREPIPGEMRTNTAFFLDTRSSFSH
jgi:hypothetical protein